MTRVPGRGPLRRVATEVQHVECAELRTAIVTRDVERVERLIRVLHGIP